MTSRYSFCNPDSHFRSIPIYHMEAAIGRSVPSFQHQKKLSLENNLDAIADEIESKSLDEFCWSLYFDPSFLIHLFYSGFLPICSDLGPPGDPVYCLLPKLHFKRSMIDLKEWGPPRKSLKKLASYRVSVNEDFFQVIENCCHHHGERNWLYPPLLNALCDLTNGIVPLPPKCPVKVVSIELRKKFRANSLQVRLATL